MQQFFDEESIFTDYVVTIKDYRMKLRMIWKIMQVKEGIIIQGEKNLQDLHLNSL